MHHSGHTRAVNTTAFTPDGTLLAAAGGDRTVLLWDVTDPAQPRRVGRPLVQFRCPDGARAGGPR